MPSNNSLCRVRIAAFEKAAANTMDPKVMASKISYKSSDRKKYDFSSALQRDLLKTRSALRQCARGSDPLGSCCYNCTFGQLFEHTGGEIANLNRVLQNLKRAGEVSFDPECFFLGVNDDQVIKLLQSFSKEEYMVGAAENEFRGPRLPLGILLRKGRSYVDENLATAGQLHCAVCTRFIEAVDRLTIRSHAYHSKCLTCVVCGSNPRQKMDFITFDGNLCCGLGCVRRYDGAHIQQPRR